MRLPAKKLAELAGLIAPETGLRLAELASHVPADMAIVEVGSYRGKSTCYLAAGARAGRGAHVYAHDAWDLPGNIGGRHVYDAPTRRDEFDAQVASMRLSDRVTAVQCFSQDAAAAWAGPPIGLLFIDASHEYADVRDDFAAWTVHVPAGGRVVFDDYDTPRNPGVKRFVDEMRSDPAWDDWDFDRPPLAICRRVA